MPAQKQYTQNLVPSGCKRGNSLALKKVLVLVLAFDGEPYRTIESQGLRKTWATITTSTVPVFFYYGTTKGLVYWSTAIVSRTLHCIRQQKLRDFFLCQMGKNHTLSAKEKGDRIYISIPDFYGSIGAKTMGALRHVVACHQFDYLFRTNTSSYVHLKMLHDFVQSLPPTRYYAGALGHTGDIHFAQGSGILLSRDLVEFAAKDSCWDWNLIDDLALARSMARAGVQPQDLPRIDVPSPDQVSLLTPDLKRTLFHVRCKSTGNNRLQDIDIMKRVHAAYLC